LNATSFYLSAVDGPGIQGTPQTVVFGMSRAMASQGLDVSWRKRLGDHRTKEGQKMMGDFACFVHCLLALSAR
jgi:hypothetical protein